MYGFLYSNTLLVLGPLAMCAAELQLMDTDVSVHH